MKIRANFIRILNPNLDKIHKVLLAKIQLCISIKAFVKSKKQWHI